MNKLDLMKNLAGVGYAAPTVEVCFVKAEAGFIASFSTGEIEDAKTEGWGEL